MMRSPRLILLARTAQECPVQPRIRYAFRHGMGRYVGGSDAIVMQLQAQQ